MSRIQNIELGPEFDGLNVVVVGGFVRDSLFGRDSDDVDLMVTEVEPEDLEQRGFRRVDATSFPVFHDSHGREVALPRTEQSTGSGHNDFEMQVVSSDVPHEEAIERDLERRDLTINAIAASIDDGRIFDPFNGQEDLEAGIVRHVSEAFREDPLRVVRAARFAARFDFEIHEETRSLMNDVAPKMSELPDDRFGKELIKALKQAESPRKFFDILDDVGALEIAFPELAALKDLPAGPVEFHQEGDALEHTLRVIEAMHERRGNDVDALLAAMAHDLGKAETDDEILPAHHGHARAGVEIASDMRKRLGIERSRRGAMSVAARQHMNLGRLDEMRESSILDVADSILDSPLSVEQMADLRAADCLGRDPRGDFDVSFIEERLSLAQGVLDDVTGQTIIEARGIDSQAIGSEIDGEKFGNMLRQDRVEELRQRI